MPCTSVTCVARRVPSRSRVSWTTTSTAEAICSRMARSGRSMPAMSTRVSSRAMASRGELACTVDSEPSWPVFIAWSMSSDSPPRHSPTTIRSGRMRSELRTRSRMVIAPLPSMFGGRDSNRTTWSCWSWSSTASSMVTIRSPSGMKEESTLSRVVFPVPVPPETMTLSRASTQACSSSAISGDSVPNPIRSSTPKGSLANLRMVSVEPRGGLVDPAADPGDDPVDDPAQVLLGGEPGGGAGQLAVLLDVDRVRAVGHDLGDRRVVQQPLQRPEAEHVVGQLGGEPLALLGAQRHLLGLDDLVELAQDDRPQRLLAQAGVVHPAAHALEQRLADAVLELGQRVGGRHECRSGRRTGHGHGGGARRR